MKFTNELESVETYTFCSVACNNSRNNLVVKWHSTKLLHKTVEVLAITIVCDEYITSILLKHIFVSAEGYTAEHKFYGKVNSLVV